MSAANQYEIDWRREKLQKAAGAAAVSKCVVGIARAGWIFTGGTDINAQLFSGDLGSSRGMAVPHEGAATRLTVVVWSNTLSGATVVRVRKNETDTGLAVTIPAGQTGTFTAAGYVYIALNERLDVRITAQGESDETIDIPGISILLELG